MVLYSQSPVTKGAVVTATKPADAVTGDVYAIITGVSNYPGISPLKFADKDALLFRDFLKTPNGGNTKPENILELINENAKAADFNVKAYSWLQRKNLKKGDRLYIYFSGHGDAMNQDLYFFLPYDCAPSKDDHNYLGTGNINMHTVKTLFIKPQVNKGVDVILIVDACRTNELPGGKEGQESFSNNFIAEEKMGDVMLLSTGAGQVSVESPSIGNGHGLFTYYLIDGLAGAADKDSLIGDSDGKVSLAEIGSYVKNQVRRIARTEYNTVQIPYYCCAEKDLATIAVVDNSTFVAWENSKKIMALSSDQNLFTASRIRQGEKGIGSGAERDTSQIRVYNRFVNSLKSEKLIGESSAEMYYNELEKYWPGNDITEDAKYSLAAKYLNFCQQKINLFISGKGMIHILQMEKEIKNDQKETDNTAITDLGEQLKKLKTLVTTGFDIAATMMEKATVLLKTEPVLLEPIIPKLDFLKTMAAYSSKKSDLELVRKLCRQAIASDPQSPSAYLLMGWIYQDMQDDSCEFYFRKAAAMAPKWAYPMNGLGNFYAVKNNKAEAVGYFFRAIQMDSLYSSAYRNIGMTYYNQKVFDSAKYYFKRAIDLDPCDTYANENYGSANSDYISHEFGSTYTDSIYFKISKRFYLKSLECDKSFAEGYQKLAALYSRTKNEDSALAVLQMGVTVNPTNAEAYRNLGTYYLKTKGDTAQAMASYTKAIALDPYTGDNYFSLARLYRLQKKRDKAIAVYTDALNHIGINKDLYNEIGNTFFEPPSQFETATLYYKKALTIDSTLDYVYYNLGKLYAAKDNMKDSTVYYYSKAVLYDPIRFQKTNHIIADYHYNNKNYSLAKTYYLQSLAVININRDWDITRAVNICVDEKNFAEAENIVTHFLKPDFDNQLYTKLMDSIKAVSGK